VTDPGTALSVLASILQTSPASGALSMLGQLLDSLPIGFYVTDATDPFIVLYVNHVWQSWLAPGKAPVVGRGVDDILPGAEGSGLLAVMREVRQTAEPRNLRAFDFMGLSGARSSWPGGATRMDWEIYPLTDADRRVTHLLSVVITGQVESDRPAPAELEGEVNRLRDEASGVLRIFGVVPSRPSPQRAVELTKREREVSDLVAMGLTNRSIAHRLHLSAATVSSHVAHILAKQQFRSRSQIATWVVEQQLHAEQRS
jgi:DNA-binding CsgD family transcriptional regulator